MITNLDFYQVFGINATQDLNTLTIKKSDLPGLSSVNPESLFVALLLKVQAVFGGTITDELNNTITTEVGQNLTYDNTNQYLKLNCFLWKIQLITLRDTPVIRHDFVLEIYTPDPENYGQSINLNLL